jgi:LEA14-like dessication related protein
MKKTIVAIVIVILLVLNIVGAALIYTNIQVLKFPETTLHIDLVEINSDEAVLHHDLQIHNPNPFDLILQDLRILATTSDGVHVANLTVDGGTIPAGSNRSYSSDDIISLKGNLSGTLTSKVTGTAGVNILGVIKKTIPLEITVLTSLNNILEKLSLPTMTVHANIGNITSDAITMTVDIGVSNPNTFNIMVHTITLNATTETGKSEGRFTIDGADIPAGQTVTLSGQGAILFDAFNAKHLLILINTQIGAAIAGYNKTLPFSSTVNLTMPPFEDYLTKDHPLDLFLLVDFRIKRGGVHGAVTVSMDNPTIIPLYATDLRIDYYRVDNGKKTFLIRSNISGGPFPPHAVTNYTGELLLPFKLLIKPLVYKRFLPDALFARLNVNFTVFGVNATVWVGINSDIDLRFFK